MGSGVGAVRAVLGNRQLRRVVLAYALFIGMEYGAWIAVLVYVYREGGSTAAGLVAVAQLVPAALAAPFAASLADRRSPATVLVGGYLLQALATGATAAAAEFGSAPLVWICSIVAATSIVTTRPAQAALLPSLVRRVEELGAANAVVGWIESAGIVLGGGATGVVIDAFGPAGGLLAAAIMVALAAWSASVARGTHTMAAAAPEASFTSELAAGFSAIRESRPARILMALLAGSAFVVGALDILVVVLAIRILERSQGWVGYLNAVYGLGGVLAGVIVALLVGYRRLAIPLGVAALVVSGSLAALALVPGVAGAVVLLLLIGGGRVVFEVSARTLLQRIVSSDVIGRVFGLVEGLTMAGWAIGAALAPLLVWGLGASGAFVGAALFLPLVGIICGRRVLARDSAAHVPVVQIGLLRALPMFRWLPAPAMETAARELEPVTFPRGDVLMKQGDVADRFYAIAEGEVEVVRDGVNVATLGRGDGVGEMGLLRAVPRTATVTARTDVLAYALEREPFLIAVTGHAATTDAVGDVVERRFAELADLGVSAN